jgi:hypothetical protein
MHFDEMLIQLGELGRYQIYLTFLINYVEIIVGMSSMSMVFTLGIDDYR